MVRTGLRDPGLESFTCGALVIDSESQWACAWVGPSECHNISTLKLDNISVGTQILMVTEEVFEFWSVKNEMGKG